jgi:O-antigen/teichoic acid export membrane protein
LLSSDAVHVARGASFITIQNIISSAAMTVSFAILARLITAEEMGVMAVLLLVNGLSQLVATQAFPQAATKFISENLASGGKHVAASIFYQTIRLTLLLAAPIGLIVFLGAGTLATGMLGRQTYTILFQVLAFGIVLYAGALPALTAASYPSSHEPYFVDYHSQSSETASKAATLFL